MWVHEFVGRVSLDAMRYDRTWGRERMKVNLRYHCGWTGRTCLFVCMHTCRREWMMDGCEGKLSNIIPTFSKTPTCLSVSQCPCKDWFRLCQDMNKRRDRRRDRRKESRIVIRTFSLPIYVFWRIWEHDGWMDYLYYIILLSPPLSESFNSYIILFLISQLVSSHLDYVLDVSIISHLVCLSGCLSIYIAFLPPNWAQMRKK